MYNTNKNNVEDEIEGHSSEECMQHIDSMGQAAQKNSCPDRKELLHKLDESLPNSLHRRLLSAYMSANANSAKESMEKELAAILLEVLDHEN